MHEKEENKWCEQIKQTDNDYDDFTPAADRLLKYLLEKLTKSLHTKRISKIHGSRRNAKKS